MSVSQIVTDAADTTIALQALNKAGVCKRIVRGFDESIKLRGKLCDKYNLKKALDKNFGTNSYYCYWTVYESDESWAIIYITEGNNNDEVKLWCKEKKEFAGVQQMFKDEVGGLT